MRVETTIPRLSRVRACDKFDGVAGAKFCKTCGWRRGMHKIYPRVWCSQCGEEFGPANAGYSSCDQHRGR
jgi:hypothetical protein